MTEIEQSYDKLIIELLAQNRKLLVEKFKLEQDNSMLRFLNDEYQMLLNEATELM